MRSADDLDPPDYLTAPQAERWRAVLSRADGRRLAPDTSLLAAWVIAEDQYRDAARAQAQLNEGSSLPFLTRNKGGQAVISPYLRVMSDATAQMTRAATGLGFNPAALSDRPEEPPPETGLALHGPPQAPPGLPGLSCNKRELARVLGVSLPTISAYLDRYGDGFPVVQSGTNGREWQFDPFLVRAFLDARTAEEEAEEQRRAEQIAQLAMPLESVSDGPADISARDRLQHVRSLVIEDELRVKRGFLVSVPAERQALTAAITRWNRAQAATVRQAGRDYNLPDSVVRGLMDRLGEAQRQLIADLAIDAGLIEPAGELRIA